MMSFEQYLSYAESEYLDRADAVYYLKPPDVLPEFELELRNKGLPESYAVKNDESAFESIATPVESLIELSFTFLIIVLTLGVIIMVLLSVISIWERKYEIGVLWAMGMKKKKVALVLWTEIITITCVCFIFGMGVEHYYYSLFPIPY